MPRPSAWTKNVLSGTKQFCLGQKKFCPGQKYFVRDKIFWSPVKSSFLFMRILFRSCPKFFVLDKIFFVLDKNFLSRTKIILSMQKDGALVSKKLGHDLLKHGKVKANYSQ